MEATRKTLREIYSIVTDRIKEHLDGRIDLWKKPWIVTECIKDEKADTTVAIEKAGQCEEIVDEPALVIPPLKVITPIRECEAVIAGMPNKLVINREMNSQPKFSHYLDQIIMPPMNLFNSSESYYEVLFHEAIHWSGHESRLARKEYVQMMEFGSEPYCIEEITAEVGACYLISFCGFIDKDMTNNIAYIQDWLRLLKIRRVLEKKIVEKDHDILIYVAANAQQATEYLLNGFVKG